MAEEVLYQIDQEKNMGSINPVVFYLHKGTLFYVEFINQLIVWIIDGLFSLWKTLTSKKAIEVYILIAKVLFFFLVIAVTILEAIAASKNNRRRNRY
jgi:hypothetical protein